MAIRAFVRSVDEYTAAEGDLAILRCSVAYVDDVGQDIAFGTVQRADVEVSVPLDATPQQINTAIGQAVRDYAPAVLNIPRPGSGGTVLAIDFVRA